MGVRNKKWYIHKKRYINELNMIYDNVEKIHKHIKAYYFTDHSIEHSIRIKENLVNLFPFLFLDDLKNEDALNDVEKFILFSAVLLHDIGIELVNSNKLNLIICKYKLVALENEKTKLDYVRKYHHKLSKYWIKENVSEECIDLPKAYIGHKNLAKYVGRVVESHGEDFEKNNEYTEVTGFENNRIRMGLLCTLLSLGDALDCDQRRITYEVLKSSDISIESKMHWMKHYYVDGIVLTPNLIQIYYSFPKYENAYMNNLYKNYFVSKTKYWIDKCFTVRSEFLFPVNAICRVVDIVQFQDDKDKLNDEEMVILEEEYIKSLCSQNTLVKYLQYINGIVVRESGEILCVDDEAVIKVISDNGMEKIDILDVISQKSGMALKNRVIEYASKRYLDDKNKSINSLQIFKCNISETLSDTCRWISISQFKIMVNDTKLYFLVNEVINKTFTGGKEFERE